MESIEFTFLYVSKRKRKGSNVLIFVTLRVILHLMIQIIRDIFIKLNDIYRIAKKQEIVHMKEKKIHFFYLFFYFILFKA